MKCNLIYTTDRTDGQSNPTLNKGPTPAIQFTADTLHLVLAAVNESQQLTMLDVQNVHKVA